MTRTQLAKLAHSESESAYHAFIASIPSVYERSVEDQNTAAALVDALHKASWELREASRAEFWREHDERTEEMRRAFPWLESVFP